MKYWEVLTIFEVIYYFIWLFIYYLFYFIYVQIKRPDSPDTYVGDVQGPINQEPDEKLSPNIAKKIAFKGANIL